MAVYGYIRSATCDLDSLSSQTVAIQEHCKRTGRKLECIYQDTLASGLDWPDRREHWKQLYEHLLPRDTVLVTSFDRISRSMSNLCEILNNFEQDNIRLILVTPDS